MSWYSRTWAACSFRACEREILKNRAVDHGWLERPEGGWLCPWHRPDRVPDIHDSARRAAGEREDDL